MHVLLEPKKYMYQFSKFNLKAQEKEEREPIEIIIKIRDMALHRTYLAVSVIAMMGILSSAQLINLRLTEVRAFFLFSVVQTRSFKSTCRPLLNYSCTWIVH
jgi:hypothetical protein